MNTIVKSGVLLGLLVCAWMFVMGFTGWYKDPALLNLFFLVIPIQIGVLIWALRQTAAQGRKYWGQVSAGTLISAIGGVIVIGGSLIFTTVAFPQYFQELATIQEQMLRQAGQGEAEIRAALEASAKSNTPIANALTGFIGTFITGLICSLAIGAFVRAK